MGIKTRKKLKDMTKNRQIMLSEYLQALSLLWEHSKKAPQLSADDRVFLKPWNTLKRDF